MSPESIKTLIITATKDVFKSVEDILLSSTATKISLSHNFKLADAMTNLAQSPLRLNSSPFIWRKSRCLNSPRRTLQTTPSITRYCYK